jgi:acylphosphatase
MQVRANIVVSGVVQGVGFRWFVEREAKKLALKGYVKNLYNGDVEVDVEGEQTKIFELIKILKIGNSASHVTDINVEWLEFQGKYDTFFIRF